MAETRIPFVPPLRIVSGGPQNVTEVHDADGLLASVVGIKPSHAQQRAQAIVTALAPPRHVKSFLDISSRHLDVAAERFLQARAGTFTLSGIVAGHSYGWFFYAPDADSAADWPPCLQRIVKLARELGCEYVNTDTDGPIIGELKDYGE